MDLLNSHPFDEYGRHGKHLYHESEPPVVAYNAADEKAARDKGYSEDYVPMEYPKAMHKRTNSRNPVTGAAEVTVVMAVANDPAEAKELEKKGWS